MKKKILLIFYSLIVFAIWFLPIYFINPIQGKGQISLVESFGIVWLFIGWVPAIVIWTILVDS